MAKPIIKFSAVAYDIGGKRGYRPQLEAQDGKYDLDLCTEVVNEKRLAMSPDELLHAVVMLGEVATKKVAEDGRPRGINKLIKWNRFAKGGGLESWTSPWNDSCKAVIRAQLLADAEKRIDATFVNINAGIGVTLANVTWIGAKSVQNVLKAGVDFAANGNHMEWLEGDSATLTYKDVDYALVCKESDVSRAVFAFPEELVDLEPGTQLLFRMCSRGGVEGGEVYRVKKQVTVIAGDVPPVTPPRLTKLYPYPYDGEAAYENGLIEGAEFYLHGENLVDVTELNFTYMSTSDGMEHTKVIPAEGYTVGDGNRITVSGSMWADGWGDVWDRVADVTFEVKTEKGSATLKAHDKS